MGTKEITEKEFLANYNLADYPTVAVTVDIVVLTIHQGRLSVLLVQRGDHPYKGSWALPGGFWDPGETLDEAAKRELTEECGRSVARKAYLEQLRTYGTPTRDPRGPVTTAAYVAFVPSAGKPRAGSDAADARFWAIEDLDGDDAPSLAFDHRTIIADGTERARAKLEYTTLATSFLDEPFTISELRRIYEIVWGVELEQNNFRRKVLSTEGFVEETGTEIVGRGKPAQLYAAGQGVELYPPLRRTQFGEME